MESSDHALPEFELSEHHEPARVKEPVTDSDNPTTDENKDAEGINFNNVVYVPLARSSITDSISEHITGLVNKTMSSLGAELSNALQHHYDLRTDRLTGTGRWFSESTKFQAWLHGDESKTLICPGIPGSGKTLLATRVVDMLQEKCSHVSI
jgi:Cdc6-like AAA superfamily ATPase